MPHFFGQDRQLPVIGDLPGVTQPPRSLQQPPSPLTQSLGQTFPGTQTQTTTALAPVATGGGGCREECIANRLVPGTPEFTRCMQECRGRGGDRGRDDEEITDDEVITDDDTTDRKCLRQCLAKGLTPGTPEFQECMSNCEGGVIIEPTQPCEGGYRLIDQPIEGGGGEIWTDEIIKPEHGWRRDPLAEGHQIWNATYGHQNIADVHKFIQTQAELTPNQAAACKKGFAKRMVNGEEFCCPSEGDFDTGGEGGPGLGEFTLPPDLQNFFDLLMKRGTGLLERKPGYSQEFMDKWFGREFESIRGREEGEQEALTGVLSRMGQLGTGAETEGFRKIQRGIGEDIAGTRRDIFMAGEERERQDTLDFTKLSQSLFGSGLGTQQLIEMINSGRRGEASDALRMLLKLLGLFS